MMANNGKFYLKIHYSDREMELQTILPVIVLSFKNYYLMFPKSK